MTVRLVPTTYADIATAMGAASSGDTIRLEQSGSPFTGANNYDIDPAGVDFTFDSDSTDPTDTVIDTNGNGRGFFFHSGETAATVIDNLSIIDIKAGRGGVVATTSFTIRNSIIRGDAGQGIYAGGGTISVTNCIVYNSTASFGGGIRVQPGVTANIYNSTIADNNSTGDGGGFYIYGTVSMTDSILWDNVATGTGHQVYINGGTLTLNYCDYSNGVGDMVNSGGTFTPSNCITSDPLFVTGDNNDYYLSQIAAGEGSDSPCLNAGSDTAANLGMDTYTTRTDNVSDESTVDIGYHSTDGVAPAAGIFSVAESTIFKTPVFGKGVF